MMKRLKYVLVLGTCLCTLAACQQTKKAEVAENEANEVEVSVENEATNAEDETVSAESDAVSISDFVLPQPNGEQLSAMNIIAKNRITIIDFWASWCGPCRAEMPNMVKIYQDCHEQGLEILGVSLDNNAEDWLAAIDGLGIVWPAVIDADGSVAQLYGIEYIPYTFVVDAKGTVLAENLRGEELAAFVKNALQ